MPRRKRRSKISLAEPDLFKFARGGARVAVLRLGKGAARGHDITYGLDAVCDELSVNVCREVTPETIDDCDIVMCSLCSPQDVMTLVREVKQRPRSRLVVGGQGVYAFRAWRHLTHRIAFGRAEGAVDECVLDTTPLAWAYDYDNDPHLSGRYAIRQARQLLKGESSVGCNGGCKFCQYRVTRRSFGGPYYKPGLRGSGATFIEDRWEEFQVKPGSVTTALDGWGSETRKRVNKPVDDEQIVERLSWALSRLRGTMRLKVFQIVGYPWETEESVRDDVLRLREVLHAVRPGPSGGRIMMLFTVTPFSPEPLTPMEDEPANIEARWRDVLLHDDLRCVFDSPHLNAFTLPQIPGPLTLYRRVAVNRGASVAQLRGIAAAKTIEEAVSIGGDLHAANAGLRVSDVLEVEDAQSGRA